MLFLLVAARVSDETCGRVAAVAYASFSRRFPWHDAPITRVSVHPGVMTAINRLALGRHSPQGHSLRVNGLRVDIVSHVLSSRRFNAHRSTLGSVLANTCLWQWEIYFRLANILTPPLQ